MGLELWYYLTIMKTHLLLSATTPSAASGGLSPKDKAREAVIAVCKEMGYITSDNKVFGTDGDLIGPLIEAATAPQSPELEFADFFHRVSIEADVALGKASETELKKVGLPLGALCDAICKAQTEEVAATQQRRLEAAAEERRTAAAAELTAPAAA